MHDPSEQEEAILDAALELVTPAERAAYLERTCAGDPGLRTRIERLLAAHETAGRFFAESVSGLAAAPDDSPATQDAGAGGAEPAADEQVGSRIGRYKLLERIGEGGCGAVYMAEQQEPVRRKVALKIIKLGMDTKNVIARFEAERQALAMMDHPNIARVLDAGATDTGRPFFVMELVRGIKITEYCDQNHFDTRRRLDLFTQVCHAIQHAHQKGIIHRDIKPSNILVTMLDGTPVPKVIDFGIAKAIEEPLTDKTLFTAYNQVIGTPAYMSPEQAEMSWLDVDTRSDIYSLGVLLYELLTGKTPFDAKELVQSGLDEMRRTLREKEPHRPSTKLNTLHGTELTRTAEFRHVEPPKLRSLLEGDLDWIVMKALEKDRARRYETANALAMDLERYLENEPVVARPPSRLYRFRKLVRRNRATFAAGVAVAVALIIGLGVSTWLFLEAERARRNEAELRRQSEVREKITQARLLLFEDKYDQADALIGEASLAQPTLEGAAVLRTLGDWHAFSNRWEQAAARFSALLKINQLDGWDNATVDFLRCGAALGEQKDAAAYERCRRDALERFARTANPVAVERIVKTSLLLPPAQDILGRLDSLIRFVNPTRNPVTSPISTENSISNLSVIDFGTIQPTSIFCTGNVAVITAGGLDIWRTVDQFGFACTRVAGDFDYRLRIHSLSPTNFIFARVGLMARDSLKDAGSRHVMVAFNAQNTFQVLVRTVAGIETLSLPPNPLPEAKGSNLWVRLQRVGTVFHSYSSTNGADWAQLYQFDSTAGAEGPFADPIHLGIATCAYSTNQPVTAVVSDFGVTPVMPVNTTFSLALLEYRRGAYVVAAEWSRRCLSHPDYNPARFAMAQMVLAMSQRQLGEAGAARLQLAQARTLIERKFENGLDPGSATQGFWFDWVCARILLREASNLIEEKP
jgi:serine/threonine protein kinase